MEVSQIDDHISHAVVGQQETEEMGVDDSAALMHILSTGLYTHPYLATIREISCNGWDGHIISGRTHIPLQVTITNTSITIRDFGPGIPHAQIKKVYGTYGKSTKRHDGKQTGGFGLGSKAPFAYVDNFEVVSRNGGVKTVYRVSKSAMALGGKPSINTIVSLPTDEEGISVTFDTNERDVQRFMRHIEEVAKLGEILMVVNGAEAPLPMLPLSESETGYIIGAFTGTILDRINVRYGNVVYPIPVSEKYDAQYSFISRALERLHWDQKIIFMADPDSISIAPNREAIILSEMTINTIARMLQKFEAIGLSQGALTGKQMVSHLVHKRVKEEPVPLVNSDLYKDIGLKAVTLPGMRHPAGSFAYTVRRAQLHQMMLRTGEKVDHDQYYRERLEKLTKLGGVDKKHGLAIHRAFRRQKARGKGGRKKDFNLGRELHKVTARFTTLPLREAFASEPKVNWDRLFYTDTNMSSRSPELVTPGKSKTRNMSEATGFLFKRVLIARNKTLIKEFFHDLYRNSPADSGCNSGWVVYLVPHNEKSQEATRELFKSLGYEVTEKIPARVVVPKVIDPNAPVAVRKPTKKRKTMISLVQCYDPKTETWLLNTGREENTKDPQSGVVDPVAYVCLNNKHEGANKFRWFTEAECMAIHQLLGDKIACVVSSQAEVLAAKGVPELKAYIYDYADKTLAEKQDFRRYLAFQAQMVRGMEATKSSFVKALTTHESLMLELGLKFAISAETALLINFFECLGYGDQDKMPLCVSLKGKVKPSPKFDELLKKLDVSPWAKYIKLNVLSAELQRALPDSKEAELPYEITRKLLK